MHQLNIITKIPEPEPDGIITIRPGESTIVPINGGDPASSVPYIHGRPAEWRDKTIPALIITISDDLDEIFRVFPAPDDQEDAIPFLAISSDNEALLSCRADGKILYRRTADRSLDRSDAMQYLHEIIAKTEYCFILCSRTNPAWIQLAGEIAYFARAQNTLTVLAIIGEGEPGLSEDTADLLGKFHTVILTPNNSNNISPASLEQIRDLCEATIDDIVASGGRHALERDYGNVRELLLNGGISYLGGYTVGGPDARKLIDGYVQSMQDANRSLVGGTYSFLRIPWHSTVDAATGLRNSLYDILAEKVPARYLHQIRIEGYYPKVEGRYDLIIWTFTGGYKLSSIQQPEPEGKMPDILIIGVGGAGAQVIRQLHQIPGHKARSIVIDRDPEILTSVSPSLPFVLRSSYFTEPSGLCGGDPDLVNRVADAARMGLPDLDPLISNPEFCFIIAGMGGNTGTGVLPVLTEKLRKRGTIVTAIVTLPSSIEQGRVQRAKRGIEALRNVANSVIVLDLNRVKGILSPGLPLHDHFSFMDHFIADTLYSICETIHPDSFMPYDATDLRTILGQGVKGTIVTGEYCNEAAGRPVNPARLRYAFGDIIDNEVTKCLIQITGGYDMCLHEANVLAGSLTDQFNPHADIVWGARVKKEMEGHVRWIMLVMGAASESDREQIPADFR